MDYTRRACQDFSMNTVGSNSSKYTHISDLNQSHPEQREAVTEATSTSDLPGAEQISGCHRNKSIVPWKKQCVMQHHVSGS